MPLKVSDIMGIMECHFPIRLAEKWDNVGLQIGSRQNEIQRLLVALDLDMEVLEHARQIGVDMIITHHPLIFGGLKSIDYDQAAGKLVRGLIESGITVYSAHTNLDAGKRGLNQVLAERIGLQQIHPLDQDRQDWLYKLAVYVPSDYEQRVREAITQAGAGHIGKYRDCSFRSQGTGTFRPLPGSSPFIGQTGELEEVEEYRLETVVPQTKLTQVLQEMQRAHPYEEVAYDLYRLENTGEMYSLGRLGFLAEAMRLEDLCRQTKQNLGLENIRVAGNLQRKVQKIAVVSGAGASFLEKACQQGCEVLLTGDVKYHEARLALDLGMAIIDAGHQGTEQIVSEYLAKLLQDEIIQRGWAAEVIPWKGGEFIHTL